ncbi:uncharacterized protein LOC129770805 isoform X2 [Toxorhynchites rutilus septentrionalis]|uniref:uncharacterized protein LOC129770805 isoform X2 n=1 Tax=Toxorhynchites rutilus septentrionalis TaxID=329112 RepID=UPI00247A100F|nr:uncharacterized protein LOC129770805 isoform X2 [Toxorhynchites rutilus septentrionalis]
MDSLLFQISSFTLLFGQSNAIPVHKRAFGEWNVALLGVLSCIGVSAMIGICVFCKRKKKGQFKLSTDNLLEQTIRNESLSSHELDGIVNYHLLQYQHEAVPNSEVVHHIRTENSIITSRQIPTEFGDNDSNSYIALSSRDSLSSTSPLPGTKTSCSIEPETASLKNSTDFGDVKPLMDRLSNQIEIGIGEVDELSQDDILQQPTRLDDVTISISDKTSFYDEPISAMGTMKETGAHVDETPMDSLDENTSITETNSIEEALRALDHAIDGEDQFNEYEDERDVLKYRETHLEEFNENNNGERDESCNDNNWFFDDRIDQICVNEEGTPDILREAVRVEATKMVDEVLLLCQSRYKEILENENLKLKNNILLEDDLGDFNTDIVMKSSTPFIVRQTNNLASREYGIIKQSLFCDVNETNCMRSVFAELDETIEDTVHLECVRDNGGSSIDETHMDFSAVTKELDGDLEQVYPLNNTVTMKTSKVTHALGATFDFEQQDIGDSLPEIMINDATEDAVSDKQAATPMNTPIELACPLTADWDKWLSTSSSVSMSCEDVHGQGETAYFTNRTYDEGWFLHTQSVCEGNDTFDVDTDQENLDSTYDLLRKQLAEVLPHAQGAKETSENFEESDSSPNRYGIQYGTLDEAMSAPLTSVAKDNEILINYKRTLSPIMEESEDESCNNKISCHKESSNYVESTSTGCMESLTAMGVKKTLMASNDTLFNFEDVLDEILSPRIPSQSHTPTNRDRETVDNVHQSPLYEITNDTASITESVHGTKSLELLPQRSRDSPLNSPVEQTKVDFSQESTFTFDEKTCISLSRPNDEDERISDISEPALVSSSSLLTKQNDSNSLKVEETASIQDDSFNDILEKEKPLENEQYNHFLDLRNAAESTVNLEPPEPDENFDPASSLGNAIHDTVYLQNKLNLENTYSNRSIDEQAVIESIDRFLLKSRNVSLPDDKSTNTLVNGHLSSAKLNNRSDGKTFV